MEQSGFFLWHRWLQCPQVGHRRPIAQKCNKHEAFGRGTGAGSGPGLHRGYSAVGLGGLAPAGLCGWLGGLPWRLAVRGGAGPRPLGRGRPPGWQGRSPRPLFTCHLSRVFCIMTAHVKTRHSNFARHCAVDAAHGRSLGRVLSNILRRVCRVPLVQYDVSVKGKEKCGLLRYS